MEDTLQKVFAILLSVIIFFLLPLYIAFEKKDDIAYSLALRITTDFVNNVKTKGYLTDKMYKEYVSKLGVTGNVYDIKLEHTSKKYTPIIYAYNDDFSKIEKKYDYMLKEEEFKAGKIDNNENLVLGYQLNEVRFNEKQILSTLDKESSNSVNLVDGSGNEKYLMTDIKDISPISGIYKDNTGMAIYPMNVGDEFTVIIKNTNTTPAGILFNSLTFGANTGNDVKIYINYGGTIQAEEYRRTVLN